MRKLLVLTTFLFLVLLAGCAKDVIVTELGAGFDIIGVNTTWVDEGCQLNINDETFQEMDVTSNAIDLTTLGEYQVLYGITYDGEDYACVRIVKVIDNEAPTATLNAGFDTITKGEEWVYSVAMHY